MRKREAPKIIPVQPVVPPQLLSIPEVASILNIGRTKVYTLIKVDGLPTVKLGSTMRVSVVSLQRWIEEHERAS
jgi:excisionase family DNA binding protein